MIRRFVNTELNLEPGTRFQYSMCHDALANAGIGATGNQLSMCLMMSVTNQQPIKVAHHRLRDAMYEDFFEETN